MTRRRSLMQVPVQHQSAATPPAATDPIRTDPNARLAGTTPGDPAASSSHRGAGTYSDLGFVPKSYASRPRGGLGPRVAHGPVERVVRHLFPAVLGERGVGAVGVLLELGARARLLLDVVGGARDHCGHGVVLAVGQEQQRRAA